uniref:DWNN domain-containing protein n=1 Tax=Percolomonas cosmopolitus TaxID=63605 RepID=A0A7S1PHR6_9EUKA|mmetsp:Transcript_5147/g.19286  ORF Transcript_5147/g.19286 Transcript_5147/m.19286 type:complete len:590 (+) Transcript_5147:189-1958(+)|eukprot:CAMPEP_0117447128 /NCGR_PEP_ID=MMETSP0759-20121206/6709_1 /TAXON_ID=63605 /ORGANISM="Percolomonas cosmopolitus, Strain WS" /LENGTH=589 /DNA_ID=CAMNT_0005239441 /DNA_START=182 /DNA_END=1951 /DNA_ORIENTATION=+
MSSSQSTQSIFYKFKSARDYDTIPLDGPFMTCSKLKQSIMLQKNLAKSADFDLKVEDVQTRREYHENSKIQANTSVLISRVPVTRGARTIQARKTTTPGIPGLSTAEPSGPSIPGLGAPEKKDGFGEDIFSGVSASKPQQSEEDRMKMLLSSTNTEYAPDRPLNHHHRGGSGRAPPAGYVCHRCGQPNHYIQDCPTNGDPKFNVKRMKRPIGIPTTQLQKVDVAQAGEKGAMVLPGGQIAVMKPNEAGFAKEVESSTKIVEVPQFLKCPMCKGLFKNAVVAHCCGLTFCEPCITTHLLENSQSTCYNCKKKLDVKSLVPNVLVNQSAQEFRQSNPHLAKKEEQNREEQQQQQKRSPRAAPKSGGKGRPFDEGKDRQFRYEQEERERREKARREKAVRARVREERDRADVDRREVERERKERERFERERAERIRLERERESRGPPNPPPRGGSYHRDDVPPLPRRDRRPSSRERDYPPRRSGGYPSHDRMAERERSHVDRSPHDRRYAERPPRRESSPHGAPYNRRASPRGEHRRHTPPSSRGSPRKIKLAELEREDYRARRHHDDRRGGFDRRDGRPRTERVVERDYRR